MKIVKLAVEECKVMAIKLLLKLRIGMDILESVIKI